KNQLHLFLLKLLNLKGEKQLNRITLFLLTLVLSIVMIGCSSDDEGASDNNDNEEATNDKDQTLVFGKTPWTSTVPPTEIAAIILEDMGYEVEQEEADVGVVFAALGSGDIDIFMDYWEANHNKLFDEFSDSIDVLSTSYPEAEWGLAVPEYMEDVNDVGDLKGKEDSVENEVIGIEAGEPAQEDVPYVLEEYDLDMELINSSEAAMLAEAKSRIDKEEPFVVFSWRPH